MYVVIGTWAHGCAGFLKFEVENLENPKYCNPPRALTQPFPATRRSAPAAPGSSGTTN